MRNVQTFRIASRVILQTAFICFLSLGASAQTRRGMTPADILRIAAVSDSQISPNGEWIVYAVSVSEGDEAAGSVERYLRYIFGIVRERAGPMLQGLMADAQLDPRFREIFRERFVRERRDAFARAIEAEYGRPANLELLLDFALGFMWYRLLVGHGALGDSDAADVAAALGRLIAVNAVARPS